MDPAQRLSAARNGHGWPVGRLGGHLFNPEREEMTRVGNRVLPEIGVRRDEREQRRHPNYDALDRVDRFLARKPAVTNRDDGEDQDACSAQTGGDD